MTQKTAFIGLGSMGYGMAKSAVRAGHTTYGFDVNPEKTAKFLANGGTAGSLIEVAKTLDAIVISVLNAAQAQDVLFGVNGIVPMMRQGAVVVSCVTVAPDFARAMAEQCQSTGVLYLDAPISGGVKKAAEGNLSIMASGTNEAFAAAEPILNALAATIFNVGDAAGAGSAMKAVNQLLAGVHIAAMAEALTFGMTQGISPDNFVNVISQCAGTSWMLEDRAPHIVAGDYTSQSTVNIWPKDLRIVLEIAKSTNFETPVTSAALQQFLAASESGLGQEDDSAIVKIYARRAGLTLPGEN